MTRIILALALATGPALADSPRIVGADAQQSGPSWRVSVTLAHPDTGWDHYADGWRIEDVDGTVLGTRDLAHPHVMEQPFTRSLSGVSLPDGTRRVLIRARCNQDGWGESTVPLDIVPGG
ncbi:hypothetical protein [Aestuariicoccus sp. MJ-SS9]|uniref:hypothetical protein n=1 Tax=Aestuariicoccus sp. MJ-SS9 TaxID=3079855 RepID=UPI0029113280|nr:hypothetical protein [Aestuariicoccus sp. MJ-SS9]MDU8909993.1 hypothetical protein [Aestuariicoccus sp. MJ-SS9]